MSKVDVLSDFFGCGAFDGLLAVLSASLVAIFLERKWSKRRAVFSLMDRYLDTSSHREIVQGIFDQAQEGYIEGVICPQQEGQYSKQVAVNRNAVIRLADFYEVIASMFLNNELDDGLFSSIGLRSEVSRFREAMKRMNSKLNKSCAFKLEAYWPNLFQMS